MPCLKLKPSLLCHLYIELFSAVVFGVSCLSCSYKDSHSVNHSLWLTCFVSALALAESFATERPLAQWRSPRPRQDAWDYEYLPFCSIHPWQLLMLFSPLLHLNTVKEAFQAHSARNLFFFLEFLGLIHHSFVSASRPFSLSILWYLMAWRSWIPALLYSIICSHLLWDQGRPGRGAYRQGAQYPSFPSSCILV